MSAHLKFWKFTWLHQGFFCLINLFFKRFIYCLWSFADLKKNPCFKTAATLIVTINICPTLYFCICPHFLHHRKQMSKTKKTGGNQSSTNVLCKTSNAWHLWIWPCRLFKHFSFTSSRIIKIVVEAI